MGAGFRDLIAWQKAYKFALEIYKTTKLFPKDELYGITAQIRRAAVSISANIAEGYERQHRKEYIQFLAIAKESLGEELEDQRVATAKLIRGLIASLR